MLDKVALHWFWSCFVTRRAFSAMARYNVCRTGKVAKRSILPGETEHPVLSQRLSGPSSFHLPHWNLFDSLLKGQTCCLWTDHLRPTHGQSGFYLSLCVRQRVVLQVWADERLVERLIQGLFRLRKKERWTISMSSRYYVYGRDSDRRSDVFMKMKDTFCKASTSCNAVQ